MPWPRLLPALLTGLLLFACYFPLAWGWLAWVALVPLLALVRAEASKKRIFFCAWAGGLAFFWAVLQWMRVADIRMYATWALLATYCALFVPVGVLLVRFLDGRTRLPLVVTVPAVWVALEFFRSHFATGFGWYLLGHTQHNFLNLIQVADLAGAYGVTWLVAAVNALVFELLYTRSRFRHLLRLPEPAAPANRRSLVLQATAVVALLIGTLAYGGWRLGQSAFAAGPRLALVQGNLDLRLKNSAWSGEPEARSAAEAMERHHLRLTDLAVRYRPDLIVWPETSWPDPWVEQESEKETNQSAPTKDSLTVAGGVAARWQTDVLFGMNTLLLTPDKKVARQYNSAVLFRADGRPGGRYDKIHCVPFGEYVPLRAWLPWMETFSPYDFDYSITPGERLTRFPSGRFRYGVLICYEDTVTYLARRYALPDGDDPPADFLLNTSNDGWFDGTAEHEQHLAICRFRAVEARRSVARAVNMGISAVIDPNGRVLAPTLIGQADDLQVWQVPSDSAPSLPVGRWGEYKKTAGVLIATIPIDDRGSFYARWGDWLPWGCWAGLAIGLLFGVVRRRRAAAN